MKVFAIIVALLLVPAAFPATCEQECCFGSGGVWDSKSNSCITPKFEQYFDCYLNCDDEGQHTSDSGGGYHSDTGGYNPGASSGTSPGNTSSTSCCPGFALLAALGLLMRRV
ncbi:MAG: hypothetical protein QW035_02365 [Candidatus Anstonellales archaeon]